MSKKQNSFVMRLLIILNESAVQQITSDINTKLQFCDIKTEHIWLSTETYLKKN